MWCTVSATKSVAQSCKINATFKQMNYQLILAVLASLCLFSLYLMWLQFNTVGPTHPRAFLSAFKPNMGCQPNVCRLVTHYSTRALCPAEETHDNFFLWQKKDSKKGSFVRLELAKKTKLKGLQGCCIFLSMPAGELERDMCLMCHAILIYSITSVSGCDQASRAGAEERQRPVQRKPPDPPE